jgi:hypothetical protein
MTASCSTRTRWLTRPRVPWLNKNLSESTRMNLLCEGVNVSVVCPVFMRTPLTDRNEAGKPDIHFSFRFSLLFTALSLLPDSLYMRLCVGMVRQP